MDISQCQCGLSGSLSLLANGVKVSLPNRTATQRLLAWLIIHGGTPVSRDQIAFELWPDCPMDKSLAALRRHHYDLEQYFKMLHLDSGCTYADSKTMMWQPSDSWSDDLHSLENALERARRATYAVDEQTALKSGLAAFPAPLLTNWPDVWIGAPRARIELAREHALDALSRSFEYTDDIPRAIDVCVEQISHRPSCERYWRRLMHLYHKIGRSSEAEQAYQECKRALQVRIRAEPSPETTTVATRMRTQSPHSFRGPVNEALRDEGRCGYSIIDREPAPILDRDFQLDDLVATICADLEQHERIMIIGPMGGGKTRIGRRIIHCEYANSDTKWLWINLSESLELLVKDLDGAREYIRERMSITYGGDSTDRTLIVLDNCDESPSLMRLFDSAMHRMQSAVSMLALSRYACTTNDWSVHYMDASLDIIDQSQEVDLKRYMENISIKLFTNRVAHFRISKDLTRDEILGAASICNQLRGNPMMIEIAAKRHITLSIGEIDQMLTHESLRLMDCRPRLGTNRRDWTCEIRSEYKRADPFQQSLLQCVAAFDESAAVRGVSELHSIFCKEGICRRERGDISINLNELARQSLLTMTVMDGESRFGIHPWIRWLIVDTLHEAGSLHHLRDAFALSVVRSVTLMTHGLESSKQGEITRKLEARRSDIQAAMRIAEEWPLDLLDELMAMIDSMRYYWTISDNVSFEREWLIRLADRTSVVRNDEFALVAWHAAGLLSFREGDISMALECYSRAAECAVSRKEPVRIARLLVHRAAATAVAGDVVRAESYCADAIRIAFGTGDVTTYIEALRMTSEVIYRTGRLQEARRLLLRAVSVYDLRAASGVLLFRIVQRLGSIAQRSGCYVEARRWFERASEIATNVGAESLSQSAKFEVAQVMRWQGELDAARKLLLQLAAQHNRAGRKLYRVACLVSIADLAHDELDIALARVILRQVRRNLKGIESPSLRSDIVNIESSLAMLAGNNARLTRLTPALVQYASDGSDVLAQGWSLRTIGRVALEVGDVQKASTSFRSSLEVFRKSGSRGSCLRSCEIMTALALGLEDHASAAQLLGACATERARIGAPRTPRELRDVSLWMEQIVHTLGATDTDAQIRAGATLTLDEAVELALSLKVD